MKRAYFLCYRVGRSLIRQNGEGPCKKMWGLGPEEDYGHRARGWSAPIFYAVGWEDRLFGKMAKEPRKKYEGLEPEKDCRPSGTRVERAYFYAIGWEEHLFEKMA
ncbi:MAG: hypothetical protein PHO66_06310 [Eubacteriales bacterium]|nr:hypothetical protein [Eubacteriales bacterium]